MERGDCLAPAPVSFAQRSRGDGAGDYALGLSPITSPRLEIEERK
jgi:hypothetical protein